MKTFFFLLGSVFISKCELCKFSLFASFHFLDFYFNSILIWIKSSRRHPRTEMKTVCVLEHVRSDKRSVYGFFEDSHKHTQGTCQGHMRASPTHPSFRHHPPCESEQELFRLGQHASQFSLFIHQNIYTHPRGECSMLTTHAPYPSLTHPTPTSSHEERWKIFGVFLARDLFRVVYEGGGGGENLRAKTAFETHTQTHASRMIFWGKKEHENVLCSQKPRLSRPPPRSSVAVLRIFFPRVSNTAAAALSYAFACCWDFDLEREVFSNIFFYVTKSISFFFRGGKM